MGMSAGAWFGSLPPFAALPIQAIRKVVGWFQSIPGFDAGSFPGFTLGTGEGGYYGFPSIGRAGLKIGRHDTGRVWRPEGCSKGRSANMSIPRMRISLSTATQLIAIFCSPEGSRGMALNFPAWSAKYWRIWRQGELRNRISGHFPCPALTYHRTGHSPDLLWRGSNEQRANPGLSQYV